jgi:hypothetical protein
MFFARPQLAICQYLVQERYVTINHPGGNSVIHMKFNHFSSLQLHEGV